MNISKKAIMSVLVASTSLVAMAQPYYHVMKREGIILTEEAAYNAKNYKIRVDMEKPRPKDAIGGRITIENFDCHISPKRSFYFTKNGNVYYNESEGKFHFEKSQLDYPSGRYSKDHCGHFCWDNNIAGCIDFRSFEHRDNATDTYFYFADPANLPKLKEDLGNEEWAVLSSCEWAYVCANLGEYGWKVDGQTCFLIDTTPDKSLLRAIESKNGGKTMTKADFESYEAQGLVCLPTSGLLKHQLMGNGSIVSSTFYGQGTTGSYWSCTPSSDRIKRIPFPVGTYFMTIESTKAGVWSGAVRESGYAVRLVVLAD